MLRHYDRSGADCVRRLATRIHPTKIRLRDDRIGFSFLLAPTEWYSKANVSARVLVRRAVWPRMPYALQFVAPRPRLRPRIVVEPSFLMTSDGRTVEYTDLEAIFGVPVTWPTE